MNRKPQRSAPPNASAQEVTPELRPAVVDALRAGLVTLERAARRGDQTAIQETARAIAELAKDNGLDQVRWQARALLSWRDDERAASSRLDTLIDGLFLSSARLVERDRPRPALH